jgi:SAM-dependent methyltransferase
MTTRLQKSLRDRGLVATARAARRRIATVAGGAADRHFDLLFGTETRAVVENAALRDVVSVNLARGIRYEPTRAIPFRRLLRVARVPSAGAFVDLGCGKGRACMLAVLHGFSNVIGVDYSPGLCRIAERNFETFRRRTGREFHATVRAMDAADYAFAPDDTVLYLYNPFDGFVLSAVFARLRASLDAHPRRVWFIYQNLVWRDAVEASGLFVLAGEWSFEGCRFAVYRHDGPGPHEALR